MNSVNSKAPLTVVILTFNEAMNLPTSVANVMGWAEQVFVLDSHSTDETCAIAEAAGATVFYRAFDNYAAQRTHAIRELPIETEWMLFLDADEYLTSDLIEEISRTLSDDKNTHDGFMLKRRLHFMGKWIRHGGYYPTYLLRLFKKEKASCNREINEHIEVSGSVGYLKNDFVDDNKNGFAEWLAKHIRYAQFESTQFGRKPDLKIDFWRSNHDRKQWVRHKIWNRWMPPFVRPFIYFFWRFFIRLGFLDGRIGFIYHFMQGLVLHFMIDVFQFERKFFNRKI